MTSWFLQRRGRLQYHRLAFDRLPSLENLAFFLIAFQHEVGHRALDPFQVSQVLGNEVRHLVLGPVDDDQKQVVGPGG